MTQLTTKDNLKLHIENWLIDEPKAIIVLVHGFGEHIGRYHHVANFFNQNGFSVIGYDRRGHGKSEGKRGHMLKHQDIIDEFDLLLETVKVNHPNQKIILYGHSQGGNVVLNQIIQKPACAEMSVVTGPWIRLAFEPKAAMVFLGKMMRSIYPSFSQPNELDLSHLSTNKQVGIDYKNDPLNQNQVTASCGMEMLDNSKYLDNYSGEIQMPLLMVHGSDDKVISSEATIAFAKRATGDITLEIMRGMYHEVHNEVEKQKVLDLILEWINGK